MLTDPMTNFILTLVVSAYCHCARCNGRAHQLTASGAWPVAGVTVAAPRAIPFGARLHVPGVGWRVVQDRLARRYDGRVDVFMGSHREARRFGVRRVQIVVEHGRRT
jgi:3D (Asp-Asp-Asp) domain-containing protein